MRLAIHPVWVGEGDFGIVVDGEAPGDHVVRFQGARILLIDEFLVERLSSSTLDFKDSPQGSRFTLDVF